MSKIINSIDISFIIPFYNGKKYIKECVESICNQIVECVNFEIIIINDCSTDDSIDTLKIIEKQYNNIVIINHNSNKKQGGARNTGIQNAKGKYIWFIDQDDYIKKDSINKLLNLAEDNRLEILQFCFDEVNEKGIFIRSHFFGNFPTIITGIDYIQDMGLNSHPYTIWSRLYKREFIVENNFLFPENRVIFEDYAFAIDSMLKAERVKIISDSEYCYRINDLSTMQKSYLNFKAIYSYHTCISCGIELIDISKKHTNNPKVSKQLLYGGIWRINQFTKGLLKSEIIETNNFFELIQQNINQIEYYKSYFNPVNRFIVEHPIISRLLVIFIKPILKLIGILKCKK